MEAALFVKKIGMTQLIDEDGIVRPVTVLEAYNSEILDRKTREKHGYDALIVGYKVIKEKKLNKPKLSYFKGLKKPPKKYVAELKIDYKQKKVTEAVDAKEDNDPENPSPLSLAAFSEQDHINIQGTSKGKGFQGTIKAHGFSRGPMTHGSKNHRRPGSIGAGTDPARVLKGTKMAKRLGNKKVTVQNLTILKFDAEKNLVYVQGAVPGSKNSRLLMYK